MRNAEEPELVCRLNVCLLASSHLIRRQLAPTKISAIRTHHAAQTSSYNAHIRLASPSRGSSLDRACRARNISAFAKRRKVSFWVRPFWARASRSARDGVDDCRFGSVVCVGQLTCAI